MSRTELESRLERIGGTVTEGPDPSFVFELEARLRELANAPALEAVPTEAERVARRPLAGVLAAAAVIVLVVGFAVAGPPGLTVRTQTPATSPGTSDDTRAGDDESDVSAGEDDKSDETSPSGTAEPRPGDRSGSKDSTPSSTDSTDRESSSTSSRGEQPEPKSMQLEAQRTTTGAQLAWSKYEGSGFAYYLVLRSQSPDDPQWPATDRRKTAVVHRSEDREKTAWSDTAITTGSSRYMVVALDQQGRVIGKSNIAEVRGSAESPIRLPATLPSTLAPDVPTP